MNFLQITSKNYRLISMIFCFLNYCGVCNFMKRISNKQRERDIKRSLLMRSFKPILKNKELVDLKTNSSNATRINRWIDNETHHGLSIDRVKKNYIQLNLPEQMNFSTHYDATMRCITTIREISSIKGFPSHAYKLKFVDFSKLKKISTSAALALTAELSKWDDTLRQQVRPKVGTWDRNILTQFYDLGFFDLFQNKTSFEIENKVDESSLRFVKYIKGQRDDSEKTKILRREINKLIGEDIQKWNFLYDGLSEAITNVGHHAYPAHCHFEDIDKQWYMTGSYDSSSKILKVVFYDQGIGIPNSLPSSILYEKVLDFLAGFPKIKGMRDATFLKAAVEVERTSTGEDDRGKGLQDLLEFVKQRGEGYLSIISQRGLYKFSVVNGKQSVKTESMAYPMLGTLIIWSTML